MPTRETHDTEGRPISVELDELGSPVGDPELREDVQTGGVDIEAPSGLDRIDHAPFIPDLIPEGPSVEQMRATPLKTLEKMGKEEAKRQKDPVKYETERMKALAQRHADKIVDATQAVVARMDGAATARQSDPVYVQQVAPGSGPNIVRIEPGVVGDAPDLKASEQKSTNAAPQPDAQPDKGPTPASEEAKEARANDAKTADSQRTANQPTTAQPAAKQDVGKDVGTSKPADKPADKKG